MRIFAKMFLIKRFTPKKAVAMLSNGKIKKINSLKSKKTRQISQLFTIEGIKSVKEIAFQGTIALREIYATGEFFGSLEKDAPCPVIPVSDAEMKKISAQSTPEGVLAVCAIPQWEVPDLSPGRIVLALDDVRDPGNMGTIVRTADWFGVRDILCSLGTVDIYNPKTVQSTMGSIARVRVHYVDLPQTLAAASLPVYGTFLDGEDIFRADLKPEGIIVIGNEANGISPAVAATVGKRLTIPRFGELQQAESLNAAVAASVVVAQFCTKIGK